ncbi:MAG: thioredoxin fold domain-containing protein [Aquificaceae bacterium]|nr:thioredoxin fold domain-containing protein [Aquificaceae bacterium]MCS7196972.1 thioredoxin fold domain-containing protein [Aquificaceae bacterium]MCX7990397.1 thioredoxin fold domain-containing protein [Aquificaceae bacterium]MDW8031931.1 thioredoxin fold domain-containing protein [Aquificaceae bacterium]MDW8294839.1 thioredoxin fold domain-containing protein [Aquificaceae bacterium]
MMKWLLLLTLVLLTACQQKANSNSEVRDLLPQNRYAMLIVESESCIYCKQLKKDLQSQSLAGELQGMDVYSILYESNARVRYILNGQERISTEEELAKSLKVSSFPQIFFYDKEGRVLLHLPGYQPPKTLACSIRYVKEEEYKRGNYMNYMKAQECL